MIKREHVEGTEKGSFMSTRPVMRCDAKGCDCKVEGNIGADASVVKERAESMGWKRHPTKSKDLCPEHAKGCDDEREVADDDASGYEGSRESVARAEDRGLDVRRPVHGR